MNKQSAIVKFAVVSMFLSAVTGCAAADVEEPVSPTTEDTASTRQALMEAPGGGDAVCGSSCSVSCTSGSCSASAGKGDQVCCYCNSGGQPRCN